MITRYTKERQLWDASGLCQLRLLQNIKVLGLIFVFWQSREVSVGATKNVFDFS